MTIFINGLFISEDLPVIYVTDRGFLLGDGLFETLKSVNGTLLFFDRHYERLRKSAEILNILFPYSTRFIETVCQTLLKENELQNNIASLRITLTRGTGKRGLSISESMSPTILITAAAYEEPIVKKPIRMRVTDIRRNEFSVLTKLKTTQYLESIMARKIAQDNGFDEGVMLNTKGMITESSSANLFFVINDQLVTPPVSDGVLPGIMRQFILECAASQGIVFEERSIAPSDISWVTAAFQTNSLVGIQLISCFDDYCLPDTEDNKIIQALLLGIKKIRGLKND